MIMETVCDGNLWLICPDKYMKTINYVANSYSIGP